MTILRDLVRELVGMFLADARLTSAILVLVVLVAGLVHELGMNTGAGGTILTVGCLAILVEAATREARRRKEKRRSSKRRSAK
jgi:uncharacterized membrane protein